jgi:hypothetical protein
MIKPDKLDKPEVFALESLAPDDKSLPRLRARVTIFSRRAPNPEELGRLERCRAAGGLVDDHARPGQPARAHLVCPQCRASVEKCQCAPI